MGRRRTRVGVAVADDGRTEPRAGGREDAEAAFRRVLSRRLVAQRGLSGADLEREVERLLGKARTMRLVDEGRISRGL